MKDTIPSSHGLPHYPHDNDEDDESPPSLNTLFQQNQLVFQSLLYSLLADRQLHNNNGVSSLESILSTSTFSSSSNPPPRGEHQNLHDYISDLRAHFYHHQQGGQERLLSSQEIVRILENAIQIVTNRDGENAANANANANTNANNSIVYNTNANTTTTTNANANNTNANANANTTNANANANANTYTNDNSLEESSTSSLATANDSSSAITMRDNDNSMESMSTSTSMSTLEDKSSSFTDETSKRYPP